MATINLLEIKHIVWIAECHISKSFISLLLSYFCHHHFTETASAKICTSLDASCWEYQQIWFKWTHEIKTYRGQIALGKARSSCWSRWPMTWLSVLIWPQRPFAFLFTSGASMSQNFQQNPKIHLEHFYVPSSMARKWHPPEVGQVHSHRIRIAENRWSRGLISQTKFRIFFPGGRRIKTG